MFSSNYVRRNLDILELWYQVMKWVEFASNFPSEPEACHAALKGLNEDLATRAVLLGGLEPSEADVVMFSTLYSFMVCFVLYSRVKSLMALINHAG